MRALIAKDLFEYGFNEYSKFPLIVKLKEKVYNGTVDTVALFSKEPFYYVLTKDEFDKLKISYTVDKLVAPLSGDMPVGRAMIFLENEKVGDVALFSNKVNKLGFWQGLYKSFINFFKRVLSFMLNHFNFKLKRDVTIIVPGEAFVSNKRVISTILGSCIAVVLWDESNNLIGMNHYVLVRSDLDISPDQRGRYGIYAIPMLINAMLENGASKSNLKAKLFGGTNFMAKGSVKVGLENSEFAVNTLNKYRIPILAKDFDQSKSRKIFAFPENFKVIVEYPDGTKVF